MVQDTVIVILHVLGLVAALVLIFGIQQQIRRIRTLQAIMRYSEVSAPDYRLGTQDWAPSVEADVSAPKMLLPLAVLFQRGLSSNAIADMVQHWGLQSGRDGQYGLLSPRGQQDFITLTAINPPQHFAAEQVEGVLLSLNLPCSEVPHQAVEILLSFAAQLAERFQGRLATPRSHQALHEQDIQSYRQAAFEFMKQQWVWQRAQLKS